MRTISWPGHKGRSVETLAQWLPDGSIGAMCEPFWGTGALTLATQHRVEGPVYIGEANAPLLNWWTHMFDAPENMMASMSQFREDYAPAKYNRAVFNTLRDGWNERNRREPYALDTAALLWCLIYASTNNLARFNQKGGYNQTWGNGRTIPSPIEVIKPSTLKSIASVAGRVNIHTDFADAMSSFFGWLDSGGTGVCFLDPPYILEAGMYDAHAWGTQKLRQMMDCIEGLEERNAWWIYTDYMRKGDDLHPYADALAAHYQQVPIVSTRDARPTGVARTKEEVITVGTVVETNAPKLTLF